MLLHGERHPEIGVDDAGAGEAWLGDANDGIGTPAQRDRRPDSGRIAVDIAHGNDKEPMSIFSTSGRISALGYWEGEDLGDQPLLESSVREPLRVR